MKQFALIILVLIASAECAKILAVLPTYTRSHYAMYGKILDGLAARNHDLTIVSHFAMNNPPANVEEVSLAGTIADIANDLSARYTMKPQFMRNLEAIMSECVHACDVISKVPAVQALLNTTQIYDLLIVEMFGSECFLPFAYKFDVPVVGLLSSVPLPWLNEQIGNPDALSYVSSYMMGYGQNMNLMQRLTNTVATLWAKITYYYQSQVPSQIIAERMFGDIPPLRELAKNYSLVLSNSHFSINDVRPIVPGMIEVGGLHLIEKQKLPQELKTLLDKSTKGVIYWSFGSMSKIETMPSPKLQQIFDVFAKLTQTVIVKMDRNSLPRNVTIPSNVHTKLWMPQYGTLCHPNVKLFISHGGLMGIQEAVACAVPMVQIPLYADQYLNAKAMEDRGVARVMDFDKISYDSFNEHIVEVLHNPRYKKNMDDLSRIFLDRPLPPLETSMYWIEYVLRHKGAKHLRSPVHNLSLHEYLLIDVLAICMATSLIIFLMTILILKYIFRYTLSYTSMDIHEALFKKTYSVMFLGIRHFYKAKAN